VLTKQEPLSLTNNMQDATLTKYSGYTEEEILPVFKLMVDYCGGSSVRHDAFHKKYSRKKYLKGKLKIYASSRCHQC